MSPIVVSLPKKERIGMAFSGGLDTSAALLWMRTNGAIPTAYVADLGQDEGNNLAGTASKALACGAEKVTLVDCRRCVAELGVTALQCGAFSVQTAGNPYFNTTPIGRIAIGIAFSLMMKADSVRCWSDGSTFKGNDIERFFKYGTLVNPTIRFYKPWLDTKFVRELGGRKEMFEFLLKHNLQQKTAEQEAYSVDSNMLGNTYEAKSIERLDYNAKDISQRHSPTSDGFNDNAEVITITFKEGRPIGLNGSELCLVKLMEALNVIGRKHHIGVSDQVEDRIIGIKSRGMYEAPAMQILFGAYERLVTCVCDLQTIRSYREHGATLGRLLYEGDWFNPLAISTRSLLLPWVTSLISGEVTMELRWGNDWTILDTYSENMAYKSCKLSMEKTASEFSATDRFGQLNMLHPRTIEVRRKVRKYCKLGLLNFRNDGVPQFVRKEQDSNLRN